MYQQRCCRHPGRLQSPVGLHLHDAGDRGNGHVAEREGAAGTKRQPTAVVSSEQSISLISHWQATRHATHFFAPAECEARRELRRLDGALPGIDAQAGGIVHLAGRAEEPRDAVELRVRDGRKSCQTADDREENVADLGRGRESTDEGTSKGRRGPGPGRRVGGTVQKPACSPQVGGQAEP